jgi:hypothetical protein
MSQSIGRTCWAIAEGYIPAYSNSSEREFTVYRVVAAIY